MSELNYSTKKLWACRTSYDVYS